MKDPSSVKDGEVFKLIIPNVFLFLSLSLEHYGCRWSAKSEGELVSVCVCVCVCVCDCRLALFLK